MSCFAIIAVRPIDEGKSRLAETLDDVDRKSLNIRMFRHVFQSALQVFSGNRIAVISRSEALLDEARRAGAHGWRESGSELNAALGEASRTAVDHGATSLLALSSDLPFLTADDIRAMLESEGDVVIATDRARSGTNALLMRRPFAIPYLYGGGSLSAHMNAAAQAGLTITVVERPGLARDIDTPADLAELG